MFFSFLFQQVRNKSSGYDEAAAAIKVSKIYPR